MSKPTTSFENDIKPMFAPYRDRMTWRLDLCLYADVKENAEIIYGQIESRQMPPSNQGSLSAEQIELFKTWMKENYPE